MPDKPTTAGGYRPEFAHRVRATCLYLATKLGDLMEDLVVIGGLVPSLLIDQAALPEGASLHAGTMDLDIGLTLGLLEEGRYQGLTDRLRRAGFSPDSNEEGRLTRQRWKIEYGTRVTVDFLIQPSQEQDRGGRLRHIEVDFAAVIAPGLHLAFRDRERVELSGETITGEKASRSVWVCGAAAYVALKALAFDLRGENKDAYDLCYLLQNYTDGVQNLSLRLQALLDDADARKAVAILRRDFWSNDAVGPRRVAQFLTGEADDEIQADAVGYVQALCRALKNP